MVDAKADLKRFLRGIEKTITIQDLQNALGDSPSKYQRRFRVSWAESYTSYAEWVRDVRRVFNALTTLVVQKVGRKPKWVEVFPSLREDEEVAADPSLVRARLSSEPIVEAALPLLTELQSAYLSRKANENYWRTGDLLVRMISVYELIEDWGAAATLLGDLARINKVTGDFYFEADALLRQGQAYYNLRDFEAAHQALTRGVEVIEDNHPKAPPYRTKLRLLNYLAMVKAESGNLDEAVSMLENDCLDLAAKHCSQVAVANVHHKIGSFKVRARDPQGALLHLTASLATRRDTRMMSEVSRTLKEIGCAFDQLEKTEIALLVWEIAYHLQSKHEDRDIMGHTLHLSGCGFQKISEMDLPKTASCKPKWINDPKLQTVLMRLQDDERVPDLVVRSKEKALQEGRRRLQRARPFVQDEETRKDIELRLSDISAVLDG